MRGGLGILIAAAVAVLAAGCGTLQVSAGALSAAVANTTATTSRVAVSTTLLGQGRTATTISVAGEFDYAHQRGVLRTSGWLAVGVQEVRFLPPRLYVRFSDLAAPFPEGKAWAEIPSPAADGIVPLMPLDDVDASPMDLLVALTAIASTVTDLGPATIRGVAVTHYRVRVDLAKAEAHLRPQARAEFDAFAGSLGLTTLPVDVWVDGQARVRRIAISLPSRDSGMPAGFGVSEAVDYYDFGVPVQVSAPPAGEVMSASEASQFSQRSGSGGSAELPPPPVSGTLSAAQASAAEQAVRAFWTALSRSSAHAVEQTVAPSQRSCVAGLLQFFRFTVKISSLRVTAVKPAGTGKATVWFSVDDATVQGAGGQAIPVAPPGAADVTWMRATQIGSVWYADPGYSGWSVFPPCLSVRH